MERRELFRIFAASAVAARTAIGQHQHGLPPAFDFSTYRPRFFTDAEYKVVDRLCDILIPSDAQSRGSHDAGVIYYLDTTLHYGDAAGQQQWRAGLDAVETTSQMRFGKPFIECALSQQEELLAYMARNEGAPTTPLERFFVTLKRSAVEAYVLSDIGMHEYLGYTGDTSLPAFPGCTHAEHKR
jgi:hypothetical protein